MFSRPSAWLAGSGARNHPHCSLSPLTGQAESPVTSGGFVQTQPMPTNCGSCRGAFSLSSVWGTCGLGRACARRSHSSDRTAEQCALAILEKQCNIVNWLMVLRVSTETKHVHFYCIVTFYSSPHILTDNCKLLFENLNANVRTYANIHF